MTLFKPSGHAPPEDATAYLRTEAQPAFYRPDYQRSLTAVMPTLLRLLGREDAGWPTLFPHLPTESPRQARKVLLLFLDGFGFKETGMSSRLQALNRSHGTWITSVFPTITSTATTTIYQGLSPARHGILGHQVWKDLPGGVVDMLRMHVLGAQRPLAEAGFDVNGWKREPGLLDRPEADGLAGVHLMPSAIVGSGLSAYCFGRTRLVGFLDPVEGFSKAGHLLGEIEQGWVGLYLSTVDALGHAFGGDTAQVALAARHLEDSLHWMTTALRPEVVEDTALMVVTDHGQSTLREWVPLSGEPWAWLTEHTRAIGFSGRVMHVYLGDADAGEAAAHLEGLVGDAGEVYPFEQARAWTGAETDDPWVRHSLGDLVVVLHDGYNWRKETGGAEPFPFGPSLASQHGALSAQEMIVPVTLAPLGALMGR